MPWQKQGRIFVPDGSIPWMHSHATLPIPLQMHNRWRIFFGTRDQENQSRIGWVDVAHDNPSQILAVSTEPTLQLGAPGTFDDVGMMPCSFVQCQDELRLYYIGWNRGGHVPYHLSIGLAISHDGGLTFDKYSSGPILDRNPVDPIFCTTPWVMKIENQWQMWYASATAWIKVENKFEPSYEIRKATSSDGVNWQRDGMACFPVDPLSEAVGVPCVMYHNGRYDMWFSRRRMQDYRVDRSASYRIGYATSIDGIQWNESDPEMGVSESGWDSEMIEYALVLQKDHSRWMFYNGNGFGHSGFGWAIWQN
jgi:predicted GH43/DUF377 family glycosyl hydrolase